MTDHPTANDGSPLVQYLRQPPPMYALLLDGPWGVGKSYFWEGFVRNTLPGLHRVALTISAAGLTTLEELERALFMASIKNAPGILKETSGVIGKMALRWAKIDPQDIKLKAEVRTGRTVICIDDLERFAGAFDVLFGFIVSLVDDAKLHVVLIANEEKEKEKDAAQYAKVKERIVGRTVRVAPDIEAFYQDAVNNLGGMTHYCRDALQLHREAAVALFREKGLVNLRTIRGIVFEMDLILGGAPWPSEEKPWLDLLFNAVTFHVMATAVDAKNDALVAKRFSMDRMVAQSLGVLSGRPVSAQPQDADGRAEFEAVIESLGFTRDGIKWPMSKAFVDLVNGADVDAKTIWNDFRVFGAKERRAFSRLSYFETMADEEITAAIGELEADIKKCRFDSLDDAWSSFKVLRGLSLQHLTRFTPEQSAEFFLSALENLDDSSLRDYSLRDYPGERSEEEDAVWDRLRAIKDLAFAASDEGRRTLLDAVIEGDWRSDDVFDLDIFCGLSADTLFDRLRDKGSRPVRELSEFVASRIKRTANPGTLIGELELAVQMSALIKDRIELKRPMSPEDSAFHTLAVRFKALEEAIKLDDTAAVSEDSDQASLTPSI